MGVLSRLFGKRKPAIPHLVVPGSGLGGEIADLRKDVEGAFAQMQTEQGGTTANRPANPAAGQTYYDTTLGQEIVWTGTAWVGTATPTGATYVVTNVAALRALANPGRFVIAHVTSNLGYFFFEAGSTLTDDGVGIIAPSSGTGRWIRQAFGHSKWQNQSYWVLNCTTGNDENNGNTTGTPIKSVKELAYRLGGKFNVSMLFQHTNTADWPATDPWTQLVLRAPADTAAALTFQGTFILDRTCNVNSAGASYPGTGEFIQEATAHSWTTEVGRIALRTDATDPTDIDIFYEFVAADIGTNRARVSSANDYEVIPDTFPYTFYNTPYPNSPQVPTQIGHFCVAPLGLPAIIGMDKASDQVFNTSPIQIVQFDTNESTLQGSAGSGPYLFCGVRFLNGMNATGGYATFLGCCFIGAFSASSSRTFTLAANSLFLGGSTASLGARTDFTHCLFQGAGALFTTGALAQVNNCQAWGCPTGFSVTTGAVLYLSATGGNALRGGGNTVGCSVSRSGRIVSSTALAQPSLTGTTELSFEGAGTAIPPLAAGAVVPAAQPLTTWANLFGASFNGTVMNYKYGSAISLT